MNTLLEILGLLAGSLTTFCWLPQAVKIIRTRDAAAISLSTQVAFTCGCALWAAYGIGRGSPSIIVFNIVTCLLSAIIVGLKLRLR